MKLDESVRKIAKIGAKRAQAFEKLGVRTFHDLICFYPRGYEDRTIYKPIGLCEEGEKVCIRAMVSSEPKVNRVRKGLEIMKMRVVDESDSIELVFFNKGYLKDKFAVGESYSFFGRVELQGRKKQLQNPEYESAEDEGRVTGTVVPIYRLTAGLSQAQVSSAVLEALAECEGEIPEVIPADIAERMKLATAAYAHVNVHRPPDYYRLELARRRLIFEELFVLSCGMAMLRSNRKEVRGRMVALSDFEKYYASLPFEPTGAQRRAVSEAAKDMQTGKLMNRLLQGDVGSGKTMVAAALVWTLCNTGYQAAFMAPTEILAEQHLRTMRSFLEPHGIRVERLTGSMGAVERRQVLEKLRSGECGMVVGTHALLTGDVEFNNLALVITDEQHRFGVEQRSTLTKKAESPHVLIMSATPIPRTLSLIIYGELDISVLDERPPGRQEVDTFAVDERYRARLNGFIERLVNEGRQAFIVCPMIEENEELDINLKPVETYAEQLKGQLPNLRIACLHGRMKSAEKESVMATFVAGEIDVLVSTTVIEVGVDVPNAALMIVENAERFGLSQLHQLRGRVGRGEHKSYCVLVSDSKGEDAKARLEVMKRTNDGFVISEEDLKIRGPGDFFGSRQHGLPELKIANLCTDTNLLQSAQAEANRVIAEDAELETPKYRALRHRVRALLESAQGKLN